VRGTTIFNHTRISTHTLAQVGRKGDWSCMHYGDRRRQRMSSQNHRYHRIASLGVESLKGSDLIAGETSSLSFPRGFDSNYHYVVPEETDFKLNFNKAVEEYKEAKAVGIDTRPVFSVLCRSLSWAKPQRKRSRASSPSPFSPRSSPSSNNC
jgi:hypothetical protein